MNDQENVRRIMAGGIRQWDAQTQSYRVIRDNDCCCQELKDEFNKVISQLEESDDGFRATEEPDYINKGWIEGLRFAITIINTKMEQET